MECSGGSKESATGKAGMSPEAPTILSAPPTSEELLALAGHNDTTAFDLLYVRHASAAMSVALATTRNRLEAEDAVQEAFLVLWRSSRSYDPQRAPVAAWLALIVRRRAIDQLRRRRPTTGLPEDNALPSALATQDVWTDVARKLDRTQLLAAMADLPPRQRDPLQLAFFGELTHVEVADYLGTPLGTTKGRIRAGLRALRGAIPEIRPDSLWPATDGAVQPPNMATRVAATRGSSSIAWIRASGSCHADGACARIPRGVCPRTGRRRGTACHSRPRHRRSGCSVCGSGHRGPR